MRRGYDGAVVARVVAALGEENAQDDARFVEAFVRSRITRGQGPVRIAADLRQRGVDAGSVDAALAEVDWAALAIEVRRRRFGAGARDWAERAKQGRFLEQRGFAHEQVRAALSEQDDE